MKLHNPGGGLARHQTTPNIRSHPVVRSQSIVELADNGHHGSWYAVAGEYVPKKSTVEQHAGGRRWRLESALCLTEVAEAAAHNFEEHLATYATREMPP